MITTSVSKSNHPLKYKTNNSWNMFYHLSQNTDWDLSSYKCIFSKIEYIEQVILLNNIIPEDIIKYCMLFIMRDGITPLWEDPKNRNGGCFSFKISNRFVFEVWKNVFFSLTGGNLFKNRSHEQKINGITISPKKNFCILKIWMSDCSLQSVNDINDIHGLSKNGCLFKQHLDK